MYIFQTNLRPKTHDLSGWHGICHSRVWQLRPALNTDYTDHWHWRLTTTDHSDQWPLTTMTVDHWHWPHWSLTLTTDQTDHTDQWPLTTMTTVHWPQWPLTTDHWHWLHWPVASRVLVYRRTARTTKQWQVDRLRSRGRSAAGSLQRQCRISGRPAGDRPRSGGGRLTGTSSGITGRRVACGDEPRPLNEQSTLPIREI